MSNNKKRSDVADNSAVSNLSPQEANSLTQQYERGKNIAKAESKVASVVFYLFGLGGYLRSASRKDIIKYINAGSPLEYSTLEKFHKDEVRRVRKERFKKSLFGAVGITLAGFALAGYVAVHPDSKPVTNLDENRPGLSRIDPREIQTVARVIDTTKKIGEQIVEAGGKSGKSPNPEKTALPDFKNMKTSEIISYLKSKESNVLAYYSDKQLDYSALESLLHKVGNEKDTMAILQAIGDNMRITTEDGAQRFDRDGNLAEFNYFSVTNMDVPGSNPVEFTSLFSLAKNATQPHLAFLNASEMTAVNGKDGVKVVFTNPDKSGLVRITEKVADLHPKAILFQPWQKGQHLWNLDVLAFKKIIEQINSISDPTSKSAAFDEFLKIQDYLDTTTAFVDGTFNQIRGDSKDTARESKLITNNILIISHPLGGNHADPKIDAFLTDTHNSQTISSQLLYDAAGNVTIYYFVAPTLWKDMANVFSRASLGIFYPVIAPENNYLISPPK